MNEKDFYEIQQFINKVDYEIENGIYIKENLDKIKEYLIQISKVNGYNEIAWLLAIYQKLYFLNHIIKSRIKEKKETMTKIDAFNLVDDNNITDYIITMIKERRLTDPLLIARFAYIELSKYLYYDISYTQIKDEIRKSIIVNTSIDPEHTKIFSYVVCSQWLELYSYILKHFGISVRKIKKIAEDHVWGEIDLDDKNVIIVDATDYIGSSIDLSNAKSISPTKGFAVVPKEYSGIRLYDIYNNIEYKDILKSLQDFYKINKELDITLKYIADDYLVNETIKTDPLFSKKNAVISNKEDALKFFKKAKYFLLNLPLPNNMDGYEAYAYFYSYIANLPINIRGNITMKTLFVDSFDYKQKILKKKFLNAPIQYLKYLENLVYSRYYDYFQGEESESIFESIRKGKVSIDKISDIALKEELKIAEINRLLNPYYAINSLTLYNVFSDEEDIISLFYEPAAGRKICRNEEQILEFKRENNLL